MKKVYVRDARKVMRAIPGLSIHVETIFVDQSVYTLARVDDYSYMFVRLTP